MGTGKDELAAADAEACAALIAEASTCADLAAFARVVAAGVLGLIPGNSVSYNEIDVPAQKFFTDLYPEPEPSWWSFFMPILETHLFDHPHLQSGMPADHVRSSTWAEVGDVDAFRQTELYRSFYAPLGIESQLLVEVPVRTEVAVVLAVNRGADDFTARDRRVMDRVAADLSAAWGPMRAAFEGGPGAD